MSKKMDRRGFLKALPFLPSATVEQIKEDSSPAKKEDLSVIRPPYTSMDTSFEACADCDGKCVLACEEKILYRLKDGSPYVSYGERGCTFCKACLEACENGVLSQHNPERIMAVFEIDTSKCVSWHGVMCFSCKDPCIDNAIKFEGIFKPKIIPELCTGCGFCLRVCPSQAIKVTPAEKWNDGETQNN